MSMIQKTKTRKQLHLYDFVPMVYLCLFAYLMRSSSYLKAVPGLGSAMLAVQLAVFLLGIVGRIQRLHCSALTLATAAFYLVLLLSTAASSRDYVSWGLYMVQNLGAVMMMEDLMQRGARKTLRVLRNLLFLLLAVNLIQIFLYPNGFHGTGYYLLGMRIGFTPFALLGIAAGLSYDYMIYGKRLTKASTAMIVLSLGNIFLLHVSAGILSAAALLGLLVIYYRGTRWVLSYWKLELIAVAAFLLIVVFSRSILFTDVVELVGEDTSFNGRTVIWNTAIDYIRRAPWLGYGVTPNGEFMVYAYYHIRPMPSHNQILHVLYEGGIVSLVCFVLIFIVVGKRIQQWHGCYQAYLATATMFAFSLLMIVEIQSQKEILFLLLAWACELVRYRPAVCHEVMV